MKKALPLLFVLGIATVGRAAETPEAILKQAQQLEDESKTARAADLYRAFLKSHPEHTQVPEARYRLAKCLDALGLVDEALLQLDAVAKSADKRFRHRADAATPEDADPEARLAAPLEGGLKGLPVARLHEVADRPADAERGVAGHRFVLVDAGGEAGEEGGGHDGCSWRSWRSCSPKR